jgi:hypothetical protein
MSRVKSLLVAFAVLCLSTQCTISETHTDSLGYGYFLGFETTMQARHMFYEDEEGKKGKAIYTGCSKMPGLYQKMSIERVTYPGGKVEIHARCAGPAPSLI